MKPVSIAALAGPGNGVDVVGVLGMIGAMGLLALAASGCGCACLPPRGYSTSPVYSTPAASAPAAQYRDTTSFYDRYREERHRREVEKQLRDIKRNTQRAKPLR